MKARPERTAVCSVCQQEHRGTEVMTTEMVHGPVAELIRRKHPAWAPQDLICLRCLTRLRAEYVADALEDEKGELSSLEAEVVRSLKEQETLSENLNVHFQRQLTLGERMADAVAEFGGSWRFISVFGAVLVVWIVVNSLVLLWRPFDPYPFILLNLVLSCLAALQAPIIMMSQNRQEAKDRLRSEHDYRVDLKAELEIRQLHWKLDQLLTHQWRRLLEIQQIQTELIEELARRRAGGGER